MDVPAFLDRLRADRNYQGQIAHVHRLPARPARHAKLSPPPPEPLRAALAAQGIEQLYSHQAEAIAAARRGENVVVVSGTASGKTLCYNLPVLEDLLEFPQARALYLFPTKALAQDQLKALRRLTDVDPELARSASAGVYDGDTPRTTRRKLRDEARILLSNPDMLHSGILPYHTRWARFWANLRTVVIDEVHSYRGIFGSNVADVIRRLRRICDHYGSDPRFILCSATIANPQEHAERLIGEPVTLVDDDGAPRGEKHFVFWNPPALDEATMERSSANVEAERLLVSLVREGVQTIAFGRARIVAELLYRYAQETLRRDGPRLAQALRAYRGGYLPAERREIEKQLFEGKLLGVTSTNALELGIDIGGLDAVITVGFPGTIASVWQQAGRAGRGQEPSVVFFVAYNEPTDQFIMRHPEFITEQEPEQAIADPENVYILQKHLCCAAAELPLREEDSRYFGDRMPLIAAALVDEQLLKPLGPAWYWARPEQPAHDTSLRTQSDNTVTIIEEKDGEREVIAQVDRISAPELVYDEAVYLHGAETYVVEKLDLDQNLAFVRKEDVDYYTQAILESLIHIEGTEESRPWGVATLSFGAVTVSWATVAFKKIKFYSTDSLGWGAVDLPSQHLETMGLWLAPSTSVLKDLRSRGLNPVEGLVGIRNAAVHMLPFMAMCDKMDIGGMVDSSNLGQPALFLYDRYQGGLGFAEHGYHEITELLRRCHTLIQECGCQEGCPSCVGLPTLRPPIHIDPDAGGGFPIPNKAAAVALLTILLRHEAAGG